MSQLTLAEVMREFMELQVEQNVVTLEVAHKRQLLQSWNDSMERSQHNRNEHRRYWDSDFSLQCQKKYESEKREAEQRFDVNQKKLAVLIGKLDALGDLERAGV